MYALAIYTPILTTSEASIVEYVGYFSYRSVKKEDHVEHHYQVKVLWIHYHDEYIHNIFPQVCCDRLKFFSERLAWKQELPHYVNNENSRQY